MGTSFPRLPFLLSGVLGLQRALFSARFHAGKIVFIHGNTTLSVAYSSLVPVIPLPLAVTLYCLLWQPAGIKFTQCVSGQKSAFSPLQENYALDRKIIPPFRIVTTFSISMQSLGRCRSENWCFLVCHAWSACTWGT